MLILWASPQVSTFNYKYNLRRDPREREGRSDPGRTIFHFDLDTAFAGGYFPVLFEGFFSTGREPDMESPHKEFVKSLTTQDRMLITLRDELYFGSWDRMLTDLRDRLKGRPYIFKLVNRIEEDIKRIEKLQAYELKNEINLSDFLEESTE